MTEQISLLSEWIGAIAVSMIVSLSPRFERGPVKFLRPKQDGLLALGLTILLAIILVLCFLGNSLPAFDIQTPGGEYTADQLFNQLTFCAIILIPFALAVLMRRQKFLSIGLGKRNLTPSLQLGFVLVLMAVFLRGKFTSLMDGASTSELLFLLAMMAVSFSEETIFRGFIQLRLCDWLGNNFGWILTSLLFTIWRILPGLLTGIAPAQLGMNALIALISGLIYGWIMRKSGNVVASGIYHGIHDWLLFLG